MSWDALLNGTIRRHRFACHLPKLFLMSSVAVWFLPIHFLFLFQLKKNWRKTLFHNHPCFSGYFPCHFYFCSCFSLFWSSGALFFYSFHFLVVSMMIMHIPARESLCILVLFRLIWLFESMNWVQVLNYKPS